MVSYPFTPESIKKRLSEAFEERQALLLSEVVYAAHQDLVKTSDFNELKSIVRDLAVSHVELSQEVKELSHEVKNLSREVKELSQGQKALALEVKELAQGQKALAQEMKELAQAQKETQQELRELAESQKELAAAQKWTQRAIGGLSRSMGYALENEAYRMAPKLLKEKYGIVISDKIIRAEIQGKEVNLLGRAIQNGKEILVVGEAKLRMEGQRSDRENVFDELDEKIKAVRLEYGNIPIVPLLVTHFAPQSFLQEAREKDIIVFQSFDWE